MAINAAIVVVAAMLAMLSCVPASSTATSITIHNNASVAVTVVLPPLLGVSASVQLPLQATVTLDLDLSSVGISVVNTATGHLVGPILVLANQTVLLLVDGVVPATLNLVQGTLLNGLFQILGNVLPLAIGI